MTQDKKIRVLIVDDSALFRGVVSKGISADPDIVVVGTAVDPFDARDKIIETAPDVMICDVVMPKMDGIEFIRRLLPQYPLRVLVVSSVSAAVLDAMNAGALDFVQKPDMNAGRSSAIFISDLIDKIKMAANARIPTPKVFAEPQKKLLDVFCFVFHEEDHCDGCLHRRYGSFVPCPLGAPARSSGHCDRPSTSPPVFSAMFADRMNKALKLHVKGSADG